MDLLIRTGISKSDRPLLAAASYLGELDDLREAAGIACVESVVAWFNAGADPNHLDSLWI